MHPLVNLCEWSIRILKKASNLGFDPSYGWKRFKNADWMLM